MRIGGIVLLVIGIIVGAVALFNHFVSHVIPLAQGKGYDLYAGIAGAVIAIIGLIVTAMAGRGSSAS